MARSIAAVAALALVLAGCGDSRSSDRKAGASRTTSPTASAPSEPQPKPKPTGARVTLHGSDYGTILADGRGRALYLFTHDSAKSRCYGPCAKAWPPFYTKGRPRAQGGVKQGLLGAVRRSDGRTQATYDGHPLYYYVTDRAPGQVTCQAVSEYGGYWYVVDRGGRAIR
jgi:predicted lipoprotein with Yx(FWY)xxD motif